MDQIKFLSILSRASKLKTNTRHCWTDENRKESVADHCFRMALMAMLISGESEFASADMDKVIRMCLIHDLGEAFTGDIPTFEKTDSDARKEDAIFQEWVDSFPSPQREEWSELLAEMNAQETKEAKIYKALDKLEAIISHNESDLSTWLPNEYDLQLTYGREEVSFSDYLSELHDEIDIWTRKKTGGEEYTRGNN